jgi:hypothetical protein
MPRKCHKFCMVALRNTTVVPPPPILSTPSLHIDLFFSFKLYFVHEEKLKAAPEYNNGHPYHFRCYVRGSLVVKVLGYKPEGRRFETRWGEFLNAPNSSRCTRPWGLLSLQQKWVQNNVSGEQSASGAWGWQPYHHLWADCLDRQPYRSPWPVLGDSFTFYFCMFCSTATVSLIMCLGCARIQVHGTT